MIPTGYVEIRLFFMWCFSKMLCVLFFVFVIKHGLAYANVWKESVKVLHHKSSSNEA